MRRDDIQVSKTVDGERIYARGQTKAEAKKRLQEKIRSFEEASESTMLYEDWFYEYLDSYKANIKAETRANYISIYNSVLRPKIARKKLKYIKQVDCIGILNSVSEKSKSYVHKVYILLYGSFEAAKDNDLIRKNPMQAITEPEAEGGHRRPLTPEERKLFLKAADNCGEAGYFCKIIYYCGLRPSEVAVLKGEDFDKKTRILSVRKDSKGKTENATRRVGIPKALPYPDKKGYLFTSKNGKTRNRDGQRNYWLKVKLEMEILAGRHMEDDLVMYCLRHDYGTRCVEAGVDIETISKTMGHSNAGFTSKVYLHPTDRSVLQALDKLDKLEI